QVGDLCDIFPTWQALETAELTWDDLIRGKASTDGGEIIADSRTWTEVNADFVDWTAVNTDGRTWQRLQEGT
ncbi:MAG: hypothetical protein ACREIE_01420, partial [Nitrospiraceae bacterium]